MTRKSIGKSPLQTIVPLKPPMVDSSMMTEPWTPLAPTAAGDRAQASLQPRMAEAGTSMDTAVQDALPVASRDSQTEPLALGVSPITIQVTEPVAAPAYAPELQRASIVSQQTEPVEHMVRVPELRRASIIAQRTEPVEQIMRLPELRRASIVTQRTDPVQQQVSAPPLQRTPIFAQLSEPMEPAPVPKPSTFSQDTQTDQVSLGLASLCSQATEPVEHAPNVSAAPMAVPDLRRSSIKALATEPVEAERDLHPAAFEALVHESVSTKTSLPLRRTSVLSQWTEPTPVVARQPTIASSATTQTEAVEAAPVAPVLAPILTQSTEPAPWPKRTSSRFSSVSVQSTEPVPGRSLLRPRCPVSSSKALSPLRRPSPLFSISISRISTFKARSQLLPRSLPRPNLAPSPPRAQTQVISPNLTAFMDKPIPALLCGRPDQSRQPCLIFLPCQVGLPRRTGFRKSCWPTRISLPRRWLYWSPRGQLPPDALYPTQATLSASTAMWPNRLQHRMTLQALRASAHSAMMAAILWCRFHPTPSNRPKPGAMCLPSRRSQCWTKVPKQWCRANKSTTCFWPNPSGPLRWLQLASRSLAYRHRPPRGAASVTQTKLHAGPAALQACALALLRLLLCRRTTGK